MYILYIHKHNIGPYTYPTTDHLLNYSIPFQFLLFTHDQTIAFPIFHETQRYSIVYILEYQYYHCSVESLF